MTEFVWWKGEGFENKAFWTLIGELHGSTRGALYLGMSTQRQRHDLWPIQAAPQEILTKIRRWDWILTEQLDIASSEGDEESIYKAMRSQWF